MSLANIVFPMLFTRPHKILRVVVGSAKVVGRAKAIWAVSRKAEGGWSAF